jgi:hypothetical protein
LPRFSPEYRSLSMQKFANYNPIPAFPFAR